MRDASFSSLFLSSGSSGAPLRIGALLDGHHLPSSTASVLDDIYASNFADLVFVVFNQEPMRSSENDRALLGQRPRSPWFRIRSSWRHLAWRLYTAIDRRRVHLEHDPMAPVIVSGGLAGVPSVSARPIVVGGGLELPTAAIASLRAANLDVILRFGFGRLVGDVLDAATYGVWEFTHGDGELYRGEPSYFWEMVERNPLTAVSLERVSSATGPGMTLAKAFFPTDVTSYARNQVQPRYGSTHFVIQKLRELKDYGWDQLVARSVPVSPYAGRRQTYRHPTWWDLVRWIGPQLPRKAFDRAAARLGRRQVGGWQVAVRPMAAFPLSEVATMAGFRWVDAPPGHMYADPFIVDDGGRTWLFFEDLADATARGVISYAEILPGGRLGPAEVALTSGGHMSYPYVFFDGATPYMVPETSSEGSVRLYRSADFPGAWQLECELFDGPAVDTSVVEHDGRWWFFTTLREPRGRSMMLVLFYADTVRGPWIFHPMNPISVDARNARGAGGIFRESGRLIRPSQDCSVRYGYGFSLREIVVLGPDAYEERSIVTVDPDWNPDLVATHTYARGATFEAVDGAVRRYAVTRSR